MNNILTQNEQVKSCSTEDPTNDFIFTLINNREIIVDKLFQNFSHEYLIKIFGEINLENNNQFKLLSNDKFVYQIMSGKYNKSKYDKSSIDWIPSEELVDGLLSVAKYFNIKHIEEIYSGMGILSALLSKKNNNDITITTADTFDNIDTCNKLGIYPIAKRSADDFRYYKQLGESYPQMIISTHYPNDNSTHISNNNETNTFVEEILDLVQSQNHEIIILILPLTSTHFYSFFYHIATNCNYTINTFHIKAIDKYFYLWNMTKKHYPSFMLAHILIKTNVLRNSTKSLNEIFSPAVLPVPYIDMHCVLIKWLKKFYDKLSPKLVKHIYRNHDFMKSIYAPNIKTKKIIENLIMFDKMGIINIPQYIYDVDEFLFWARCVTKNLFFVFANRSQFYMFYTETLGVQNSETRQNLIFPVWVQDLYQMYKFIYLKIISPVNKQWISSKKIFNITFSKINMDNKQILSGN